MIFALLCALLAAPAPQVTDIDIDLEGRGSTADSSIRRMMNTTEGMPLDLQSLEHDLMRLRATGVLYEVSAELDSDDEGDGTELTIHARDRWSLLPVFGLRHGGGRTTARVGVAERNALGRLVTLTAELQSASAIPFADPARVGSLVTALVPRAFGTRLSLGVSWQREFLDFTGWDGSGAAAVVYDRSRHLVRADARYELTDLLVAALGLSGQHDSYALDGASPLPSALPAAGIATVLSAEVAYGLLDDRVTTLEGTELRLRLEGARQGAVSDFSFGAASATLRSFFLTRPGENLGVLLSGQATSARSDSFLFRAGGLTEIRGFPDAYFIGRRLVRANVEYRAEVLQTDFWLPAVTQVVGFVDAGHVSGRADAIGGLDYEGLIASVGGGLRLIIPPIARAIGRVDVAVGMYPRRTIDLSLGGQQFF